MQLRIYIIINRPLNDEHVIKHTLGNFFGDIRIFGIKYPEVVYYTDLYYDNAVNNFRMIRETLH